LIRKGCIHAKGGDYCAMYGMTYDRGNCRIGQNRLEDNHLVAVEEIRMALEKMAMPHPDRELFMKTLARVQREGE